MNGSVHIIGKKAAGNKHIEDSLQQIGTGEPRLKCQEALEKIKTYGASHLV